MAFVVEIRVQCEQCGYVTPEFDDTKSEALAHAKSNGWKIQKGKLVCDGCLAGKPHESFDKNA